MFLYGVSLFFFFFKQKTAYEMRISDWSSDVCSSDLVARDRRDRRTRVRRPDCVERFRPRRLDKLAVLADIGAVKAAADQAVDMVARLVARPFQIGRASCRERVCQYV